MYSIIFLFTVVYYAVLKVFLTNTHYVRVVQSLSLAAGESTAQCIGLITPLYVKHNTQYHL